MIDPDLSRALNAAGEALKATGLSHVSITLTADGTFSVGLSATERGYADCFGHSASPAEAYLEAEAKRAPKAREMAVRAEIEQRVRAELDEVEQREAA